MKMAKLSPKQIEFYHDKGYIVLRQLIDIESLNTYRKRFLEICNGLVPKEILISITKEHKLKERSDNPEDYVNKIQDFLCDDVLVTYAENPRLFQVVSQFIGTDIRAMHSMLINKPPGTDEHPPHQDIYYFPFRPADKIIASWTAIDTVTYENGCLWVVPGSHKEEKLYAHDYTSIQSKMYHGILDQTAALEDERIHLEMNPGDTVLFHPYLIHGSRPNISKNYRKAISCHFASSDVRYIDVQGSVQDAIAAEVVAEAKRRGYEATFADIWKYKSVAIKPAKSHL